MQYISKYCGLEYWSLVVIWELRTCYIVHTILLMFYVFVIIFRRLRKKGHRTTRDNTSKPCRGMNKMWNIVENMCTFLISISPFSGSVWLFYANKNYSAFCNCPRFQPMWKKNQYQRRNSILIKIEIKRYYLYEVLDKTANVP